MARAGLVLRFLKPCAVAVFLGFLAACGGGGGGGEPVRTVTTVTVTSPTMTPKQSDTVQLTAVARDQFGEVMSGSTASWSSSAPAVATVSATGLLQALAGGTVTVTATISNVAGTLMLTITPRVTTTVTVSSPTASPTAGETVQLTVVARDQFGDVLPGKAATWSTSDAKVATISSTGLLRAMAPGTLVATATIDGLPGSVTLTVVPGAAASVTVSSPTATPQAGEAVQLTADVRDRDGNLVPAATVSWSTSDAQIATVSASGLLQALTPGSVVATATAGGVAGSVPLLVLGPPAAYFINGVEYAFDYQLDAQGRVSSYRISKRRELAYEPGDYDLTACSGDLHGNYWCGSSSGGMFGEEGKVTRITRGPNIGSAIATFSYGPYGLSGMAAEWHTGLSSHEGGSSTTTLTYDALGRLKEVKQNCGYGDLGNYGRDITTAQVTVDSRGRLTHAEHTVERQQRAPEPYYDCSTGRIPSLFPEALNGTIDWTYDGIGFMTTAGPTTYSVDSDGYLVARRLNGVVDTYAIIRSGQRIAEEHFTQAEPRAFYRSRAPQRVRYQSGRLPTEPLFVPRALTGLNGADYFGILSSHHR